MRTRLPSRHLSSRRAAVLAPAALVLILSTRVALAHDPGLSALDLRIWPDRIVATLSLSASDAGAASTAEGIPALDSIQLTLDGRSIHGIVERSSRDDDSGVRIVVRFDRPPGTQLTVRSALSGQLPAGHRQLVTVRGTNGEVLSERMLDSGFTVLSVDLTASERQHSVARRFLALGVQHILGGYDHLLFVTALLLGIAAQGSGGRPSLAKAAGAITAFTVAHSITLALGASGFAYAPPRVVEPLIAASIVFVGVDNLVRRGARSRWLLTFGFGLIHGFGFAGALQDLGVIGARGLDAVVPLACFNAGVEIGQIGVAALLWPLVRRLSTPSAHRWRLAPICSLAVVAAGLYWLIQRTIL